MAPSTARLKRMREERRGYDLDSGRAFVQDGNVSTVNNQLGQGPHNRVRCRGHSSPSPYDLRATAKAREPALLTMLHGAPGSPQSPFQRTIECSLGRRLPLEAGEMIPNQLLGLRQRMVSGFPRTPYPSLELRPRSTLVQRVPPAPRRVLSVFSLVVLPESF